MKLAAKLTKPEFICTWYELHMYPSGREVYCAQISALIQYKYSSLQKVRSPLLKLKKMCHCSTASNIYGNMYSYCTCNCRNYNLFSAWHTRIGMYSLQFTIRLWITADIVCCGIAWEREKPIPIFRREILLSRQNDWQMWAICEYRVMEGKFRMRRTCSRSFRRATSCNNRRSDTITETVTFESDSLCDQPICSKNRN